MKAAFSSKMFDEIGGEAPAVFALRKAVERSRVSHCMLFAGPKGSGRRAAAKALAAALNCTQGGCGECLVCRAITKGLDPDTLEYEPEGRFIQIEQVRDIQREMALKPFRSRNRFFIINECERLTVEASNALLKSLEEPSANLYVVLVTEKPEALLPTIASRAQMIRFSRISEDILKSMMSERYRLEDDLSSAYAKMAGGSIDRAITFCEADWFPKLREEVLSIASRISDSNPIQVYEAVENLLSIVKEPLKNQKNKIDSYKKEMRELLQDEKSYKRLEKTADSRFKRIQDHSEREGLSLVLSILSSYYRDLLVQRMGAAETSDPRSLIVNVDKYEEIKKVVQSADSNKVEDALAILAEKQSQMNYNINVSLFLETVLLSIGDRLCV